VVEVRLTVCEFPTCPHRLLRGAVLTFGVVLGSFEVVLVFFERVTGVENVFVRERDRGDVLDAKVNPRHFVACGVVRFEFDFADEVQFPLVAVPDGANVLHSVDFREVNVRARLVLAEQEVRPVFFQVRAFREPDAVVLGVVFEPVFFECHRGTRSGVAVFAVAGWIRLVKLVSQVEPRLESVRKFFDDFLTGLRVQVFPARPVLHTRFQNALVWDFSGYIPDSVNCPSCDVPDFRGGVSERIEAITDLSVVLDGTNVGASDLNRHT